MPDAGATVIAFLGWVLYPAWLVAGGCDYLCHRATQIGLTSGPTESWLHLAQFASLLLLLCAAIFGTPSPLSFSVLALSVLGHTALSIVDVSYTQSRRHISVFEQFVHGVMDVVPLVAVALLIFSQWEQRADFALRSDVTAGGWLVLGTFVVLSGIPILEELLRTHRQAARAAFA